MSGAYDIEALSKFVSEGSGDSGELNTAESKDETQGGELISDVSLGAAISFDKTLKYLREFDYTNYAIAKGVKKVGLGQFIEGGEDDAFTPGLRDAIDEDVRELITKITTTDFKTKDLINDLQSKVEAIISAQVVNATARKIILAAIGGGAAILASVVIIRFLRKKDDAMELETVLKTVGETEEATKPILSLYNHIFGEELDTIGYVTLTEFSRQQFNTPYARLFSEYFSGKILRELKVDSSGAVNTLRDGLRWEDLIQAKTVNYRDDVAHTYCYTTEDSAHAGVNYIMATVCSVTDVQDVILFRATLNSLVIVLEFIATRDSALGRYSLEFIGGHVV